MDGLILSGAGAPHGQNTFLQEHAAVIIPQPVCHEYRGAFLRVPSDYPTCDVFLE